MKGTDTAPTAVRSDDPIQIVGLRKEYGPFTALDGLTLSVRKNSFTGLLGPNGAGKSTTLKILTHLISATSGKAYLNGTDVTYDPKKALRNVGTVVETPEFYGYLTPRKTMRYLGRLIGMTSESISSQTEEILEEVHMTEWGDKPLGTFSKGMRQRIALGQALLGDPNIIILDEPTSGLDPRGMAEIRETLKNIRNGNNDLTILMSSHMLHEVSDLCDRIALVNHGKLLLNDTIDAVENVTGRRRMTVSLPDVDEHKVSLVAGLEHVLSAERLGNEVSLVLDVSKGDCRGQLYSDLDALGIGVYGLSEDESLESVYLDMIKESG